MKPLGGTELQYALLHKYVDKKLLNNFQITTSVPEKIPLAKDKINILWEQNSYDQPNIVPWMKDKANHSKYDWYVFNSHWCAEKYRMVFQIPTHKCVVIKNAIDTFPEQQNTYKKGNPINLVFTSTPWRGLSVLLGAMQLVKNPLIKCHVYSSTKIYGSSFEEKNNAMYKPLYEQAKQLKNVVYKGYATNQEILHNMKHYHIYTYPNIWEETSCISAIEALSFGLHAIVTNYGALYETCSEWPTYVQYNRDYKSLAQSFAYAIEGIAEQLHTEGMQELQKSQMSFYKKFYNWNNRKHEWTNFLQGVVDARKS
jgi:UDP-glucose:(glucosyl)LPS alpha-1,2-glucosyltransferase